MNSSQALLLILVHYSMLLSAQARLRGCSKSFDDLAKLTNCKKLPTLGAELAWRYQNDDLHNGIVLSIVFGAKLESEQGWVACGVNPKQEPQMVGTRAIIGLKHLNGSLTHDTYNITLYTKRGCELLPTKINEVQRMDFRYVEDTGYHILSATLNLPTGMYDKSKFNIIWQVGYRVEGAEPKMHPTTLQHVDSIETLNLETAITHTIGHYRTQLRAVHGILNIVGWGTFLPVGAIIARHFRRPEGKSRMWFYLHFACQIMGYTIGTAGWIIGLWLGHASKYYTFQLHKILAAFIFTFATLQMLSFIFKPIKITKRHRNWSIYHHAQGYSLMLVIGVNIFQGIHILKPDNYLWKFLYIGILVVLGVATLSLEAYTWINFLCDRFFKDQGIRKSVCICCRR